MRSEEENILNRIEKEIQEQEKYLAYCNKSLKILTDKEDINTIKTAKSWTEHFLYILKKIKKYKNVPLKKNYLNKQEGNKDGQI